MNDYPRYPKFPLRVCVNGSERDEYSDWGEIRDERDAVVAKVNVGYLSSEFEQMLSRRTEGRNNPPIVQEIAELLTSAPELRTENETLRSLLQEVRTELQGWYKFMPDDTLQGLINRVDNTLEKTHG